MGLPKVVTNLEPAFDAQTQADHAGEGRCYGDVAYGVEDEAEEVHTASQTCVQWAGLDSGYGLRTPIGAWMPCAQPLKLSHPRRRCTDLLYTDSAGFCAS